MVCLESRFSLASSLYADTNWSIRTDMKFRPPSLPKNMRSRAASMRMRPDQRTSRRRASLRPRVIARRNQRPRTKLIHLVYCNYKNSKLIAKPYFHLVIFFDVMISGRSQDDPTHDLHVTPTPGSVRTCLLPQIPRYPVYQPAETPIFK